MSVATPHPQYLGYINSWASLRDCYEGSGAIKAARPMIRGSSVTSTPGTRYLPRPAGMKLDEHYAAYRDRASFIPALERAVQGITGSIFRHEPQIAVPTALDPQIADITQTGVSLRMFAEQVTRETLLMGRYGLLVDFPAPEETPTGELMPPPPDSRPYWIGYQAEEIINWRTLQRGGDTILSLVVLRESVPEVQGLWGSDDFFKIKDRTQYRVLRLNDQGLYEVSLWGEVPGASPQPQAFVLQRRWIPDRQRRPLDFIPFVFLAPFSLEPAVEKSLMEGLAERNYKNYHHSADKEHALHLTAMPTFYVAANMEQPPELYVGANMAIFLPDNQAKVGLVEFHGQGLQPHENAMKEDLEIMAALGARLLEGPPQTQETATGVTWRLAGSDSPTQALVSVVSQGLTWALQTHTWWSGLSEDIDDPAIHMDLNKDLVSTKMPPQMLQALMQALLNGTITRETFYWNMQQGEIARPGVPFEDEEALLELEDEKRALVMAASQAAAGAAVARRNGQAPPAQRPAASQAA